MLIYLLAFSCDVAFRATFLYQSQNVCNSIYNNKFLAEGLKRGSHFFLFQGFVETFLSSLSIAPDYTYDDFGKFIKKK